MGTWLNHSIVQVVIGRNEGVESDHLVSTWSESLPKQRLGERVEVAKDLSISTAEGVGLIEDRRDSPLLVHGWRRNH